MDEALTAGISTPLLDFFERVFLLQNVNIKTGQERNYRIAIRFFNKYLRRQAYLSDLSEANMLGFIRYLQSVGGRQGARTINNKRALIKTLWKAAHKRLRDKIPAPGVIGKLTEPKRLVEAWSVGQVATIVDHALAAPKIQHWDGRHWRFLVLVIYDTSHRLNALMQTPASALRSDGHLLVLAEHSKGNVDKLHKLSPDTIEAWNALPKSRSGKLIDWPLSVKEIFPRFREVLTSAGLPATRRDLFHKLRRTSYTYVYALLGPVAASDHAAHTTDLSRSYLDKQLLAEIQQLPKAIDVLPRPRPK